MHMHKYTPKYSVHAHTLCNIDHAAYFVDKLNVSTNFVLPYSSYLHELILSSRWQTARENTNLSYC